MAGAALPPGGTSAAATGSADPVPVISERRQHPAYLLISAGQTLRALIPAIVGVTVWRAHWWVAAAAGGVILAIAVLQWWTHRYAVVQGALRVRSGALSRSVHTVPISRITSLDAHRGVIQRVLGVWGLKVQTPGDGRRSTVRLHCLSGPALEDLRRALDPSAASRSAPATGTGDGASVDGMAPRVRPDPAGAVVAMLGTRDLLIAAVTGTSIPLLLAGGAAAWNRARDLLPDSFLHWLGQEVFNRGAATLAILALLLLVAAFVAVVITALRLARFTVVREPGRLRLSRGLLAQRSSSVPVDRIQAVRIVEGLWRKPFGLCSLEVEVSGMAGGQEQERALFPLLPRSAVPALLARAIPELGWAGLAPGRIGPRARRRYPTLPVLIAAPAAAGLAFLPGWWALIAAVPLGCAVAVGLVQARTAAWSMDERTTVLRWHRVLATHTVIARTRRVQIVRRSSTPFQRRAGMAGVTLLLSSSRRARLRHVETDTATLLLHVVGRRAAVLSRSGGVALDPRGREARSVVRPYR